MLARDHDLATGSSASPELSVVIVGSGGGGGGSRGIFSPASSSLRESDQLIADRCRRINAYLLAPKAVARTVS